MDGVPRLAWAVLGLSLATLPLAIALSDAYPAFFLIVSVGWLVSPMFFTQDRALFNLCLAHSLFFVILYVRVLAVSAVRLFDSTELVGYHVEQAAALVVLLLLARHFFSLQFLRIARQGIGKAVAFGLAVGLPFGVLDHLSGERIVGVPSLGWPAYLLWAITLSLLVGMVEEVLFRGVFYRPARNIFGPRTGSVFQALLFSLVHYPNPPSALAAALLFGVIMVFLVERTGNIFGPVVAHFSNNTIWMSLARCSPFF